MKIQNSERVSPKWVNGYHRNRQLGDLKAFDIKNVLESLENLTASTNLYVDGIGIVPLRDDFKGEGSISLDFSNAQKFKKVELGLNNLTSLNVSGLTTLERLLCVGTQLTSLNVGGLTALRELYCRHNQLTSLNVNDCTVLRSLDCSHNQLSTTVLNEVFNSLPDYGMPGVCFGRAYFGNNPGTGSCNRSILWEKGWCE